jgi:deoxycytidine triphosphate deaminase
LLKENEFLRLVSENIVFAKNDVNNLNQFEKGINSRNRNGLFNQNFYKTDLRVCGNGTIMKDNNSSVVHNESYAEENSFTFIEKENKKNENNLIIIQDLNCSGIISDSNVNIIISKFYNFIYV